MAKGEERDPHLSAVRYLADRAANEYDAAEGEESGARSAREAEGGEQGSRVRSAREADASRTSRSTPTPHDRAMYVETAIQQAIRRGEFDDLPGAGKPLTGLGSVHDPDWWIRRKIQRENLTGLGPPALTLRVEHRELESRLDALTREDDVRAYLEDFNRRVIEARRQLLGGPPVVTPVREVDAEVEAWRTRRTERESRGSGSAREADVSRDPRPWFRRFRRGSRR